MSKITMSNKPLSNVFLRDVIHSVVPIIRRGSNVCDKDEKALLFAIKNSAELFRSHFIKIRVSQDSKLFRQAMLFGTEEVVFLLLYRFLAEIQTDPISRFFDLQFPFLSFFTLNLTLKKLLNDFLNYNLFFSRKWEIYPILLFFTARLQKTDLFFMVLHSICMTFLNFEKISASNRKMLNDSRLPTDLNVRGFYGETALYYAVIHQLVDVARFLLEHGSDPNCHDVNNFTPLFIAAFFENEEMCKLLLDFKANINSICDCQRNPLGLVCGVERTEILRDLKKCYFIDEIDCYKAGPIFNLAIMKLLLEKGANPNCQDGCGVSILLNASEHGRFEELMILLKYGANIEALDSD